jgi:hypothetical protein
LVQCLNGKKSTVNCPSRTTCKDLMGADADGCKPCGAYGEACCDSGQSCFPDSSGQLFCQATDFGHQCFPAL